MQPQHPKFFTMKRMIFMSFLILLFFNLNAQERLKDSITAQHIQEVIVIGTAKISSKENKPLGSIDEYLQKSSKVDMIKRGAYAWEPLINSMPTERTLVTIDGMRIFGACTDKMDPVTSYIEVSNLKEATIVSGQEGSCHGNTIGGALDLKRNKMMFGHTKWNTEFALSQLRKATFIKCAVLPHQQMHGHFRLRCRQPPQRGIGSKNSNFIGFRNGQCYPTTQRIFC